MARIAVIGLGEAGRHYVAGLAERGAEVSWYDVFVADPFAGIEPAASLRSAVARADLVISLVGANAATSVCQDAVRLMAPTSIFADFNTCSPVQKTAMAATAKASDVEFVDVAVMAPVPRDGISTPLLVSGSSAERFARLLQPFGPEVGVVSAEPGAAAARKLLRSVFMKGLAAVLLECEFAGKAADCWDWLAADIAQELGDDGAALVERLLTGSRQHAVRRAHEMTDAANYLAELGVPNVVAQASVDWFQRLESVREKTS